MADDKKRSEKPQGAERATEHVVDRHQVVPGRHIDTGHALEAMGTRPAPKPVKNDGGGAGQAGSRRGSEEV